MDKFIESFAMYFAVIVTSFAAAYYTLPGNMRSPGAEYLPPTSGRRLTLPVMGGAGIYLGLIISGIVWLPTCSTAQSTGIVLSSTVLLIAGIVRDLKGLSWSRKIMFQSIAALIAVRAGFVIPMSAGLPGDSLWIQYSLSIVVLILVSNAYHITNEIESIFKRLWFIHALLFAGLFYLLGNISFVLITLALAASLLAFLRYSSNTRKIFIGDSGSLVVSFLLALAGVYALQLSMGSAYGRTIGLIVFALPLIALFYKRKSRQV